jgi:nucleoside-diphosphate-sugar epimerase
MVPFDGTVPTTAVTAALRQADHVLVSVPPGPDGDRVLACHGPDIAAMTALQWLGYLSTTGPYGDRQGGWVDETTPPVPSTERGQRRLDAENAWLALYCSDGVPVHIFRLAGIYGPGRNQLADVAAGKARRVVKPGQVFSRIHVDDIAAVVVASMARPRAGAIYNVCDDEAAPPQDVVTHAAALLGVDPPPEIPFAEAALSPMARSFFADSKRVRNDLIKSELGVELAYPTYRDGLAALLSSVQHN